MKEGITVDNSCFYCTKDERLSELMIEICKLEVSTLYLFKEQTHKGRCIVTYKEHGVELFNLSDEELALFMKDVKKAALAINKAFSPDKVNYGAYADKQAHLHMHVVPKYKDGYSWGTTFEMMPQNKKLLSSEEYAEIINKIKDNL
jgi:Diadenosine tetraphosphate (Ap4A) hydrolase and other HIT family hydrolases